MIQNSYYLAKGSVEMLDVESTCSISKQLLLSAAVSDTRQSFNWATMSVMVGLSMDLGEVHASAISATFQKELSS